MGYLCSRTTRKQQLENNSWWEFNSVVLNYSIHTSWRVGKVKYREKRRRKSCAVYTKQTKYNNSHMRIFRFFVASFAPPFLSSFRSILFINFDIFRRRIFRCSVDQTRGCYVENCKWFFQRIEEETKSERGAFRGGYSNQVLSLESGIEVIDAPSSTLSSMVWIFRRPSLAQKHRSSNELGRVVLY